MLIHIECQAERNQRTQPRGLVEALQLRRLCVMHQSRIIDSLQSVKFRLDSLFPALAPAHRQTLSAHRNFALLDRGFAEISCSRGGIPWLVSTFSAPSRSPC